jgi:hypothetical protein
MTALIPVFISALPSLLAVGESLWSYITTTKAILAQDTAWTDVQDQQWQAALIAAGLSPEWTG